MKSVAHPASLRPHEEDLQQGGRVRHRDIAALGDVRSLLQENGRLVPQQTHVDRDGLHEGEQSVRARPTCSVVTMRRISTGEPAASTVPPRTARCAEKMQFMVEMY